jgi:hypothetical protein
VKADEELDLLKFGILELDTPVERFAALKILVDSRKRESLDAIRDLIPRSRHPEMQAMLLHMVALPRDPRDIPLLERMLASKDAEVRGAAAESLGFLHAPTYPLTPGITWSPSNVLLATTPPIDVSELANEPDIDPLDPFSPSDPEEIRRQREQRLSWDVRDEIEAVMLQGKSREEREAAARGLVTWPPATCRLRLAEWGVWIDGPGKLEVAKSVLEEIPPFVHRTGNPAGSLSVNRPQMAYGPAFVTKPIIHLTSERALAVDLEIAISNGRPWFAFPRPDCFTVHEVNAGLPLTPEMSLVDLDSLEAKSLPALDPVFEGYPWIHPSSRNQRISLVPWSGGTGVSAIGLRWQSLIVSPGREPWMALPDVSAKPGYSWWTSLRDVPSSWITSQGETERFFYYDGPTLAKSPVSARLEKSALHLKSRDIFSDRYKEQDRKNLEHVLQSGGQPPERDCLFVERRKNSTRGFRHKFSTALGREETLNLAEQKWLTENELEKTLLTILLERGLTAKEAGGLIESWREKFLHNSGKRLLTFLTPAEYNRMCQLRIRPASTEEVRVGIVLTEL